MLFGLGLFLFIVYTAALNEDIIYFVDGNELQKSEDKFKHKSKSTTNSLLKEGSIQSEKVSVRLYYETLCPFSIDFYTGSFLSVVEKLGPYLDIKCNPYGNAETIVYNGKYTFKCQHGPKECYGNKLHACAKDVLQNITRTIHFNACMMKKGDFDGSNDKVADACSKEQNIDANPIKECAKGDKGSQLLKEYGDDCKKINLQYVPCVYINDKIEKNIDYFMRDICAAFTNPPPLCKKASRSL